MNYSDKGTLFGDGVGVRVGDVFLDRRNDCQRKVTLIKFDQNDNGMRITTIPYDKSGSCDEPIENCRDYVYLGRRFTQKDHDKIKQVLLSNGYNEVKPKKELPIPESQWVRARDYQ